MPHSNWSRVLQGELKQYGERAHEAESPVKFICTDLLWGTARSLHQHEWPSETGFPSREGEQNRVGPHQRK